MKFTSKEIALIGLLGAVNGIIEITVGTYLHVIGAMFTGNIMIGLTCIVYMLGRRAIPKKGSIFLIGTISAFLKFLFGWSISAAIAIFMEGLLMELIVSLIGFNMAGVIFGAVAANLWALAHRLIGIGLIGGEGFFNVLSRIVDKTFTFLHIDKGFLVVPFLMIIIIYAVWGVIFGLVGWKFLLKFYPRIASKEA